MGQSLSKIKSDFPPFADRKELAANITHFCIDEAKEHTQKDGKTKWYLTIRYGDGRLETLTFDQGAASRDEKVRLMIKEADYPYHSCYVKAKPLPGKPQPFYNIFQEGEPMCSCSMKESIPEPPEDDDPGLSFEEYSQPLPSYAQYDLPD